jgi:hypothetical protein
LWPRSASPDSLTKGINGCTSNHKGISCIDGCSVSHTECFYSFQYCEVWLLVVNRNCKVGLIGVSPD